MSALWNLLDILQLLFYYLFINVLTPNNFVDFLMLFKIATLPLPNIGQFFLDIVLEKFHFTTPSQTAPEKFENYEITSLFLTNGLFIDIYMIFIFMIIKLFRDIEKFFRRKTKSIFLKNILVIFKWNFLLRFILTSFIQLTFASCLQFYSVDFQTLLGSISTVFAILSMIFCIYLPLWCKFMMRKRFTHYSLQFFSLKYGALSDEYKNVRNFGIENFPTITLVRKFLFIVAIVLIYYVPALCLCLLSIQSIGMAVLIYRIQPYERESTNSKLIFQEIILLFINTILLMIYESFIESDENRSIAGYVLIGLCVILLIYPLIFVVKDTIAGWILAYKSLKKVIIFLQSRRNYKRKILKSIKKVSSQTSDFRIRTPNSNHQFTRRNNPTLEEKI